jgi:hypothetical protein
MSWNYRIFRHSNKHVCYYQIHEAYYDDSGKVELWTENSASPFGETVEELLNDTRMMLNDIEKSQGEILEYT